MAKDIAKVREQESHKERERIAALKLKKDAVLLPRPWAKQEQLPKRQLMPKRPLSPFEKVFVRVVVGGILLFVFLNAAAFGFWYLSKRDAGKQESQGAQQKAQTFPISEEQTPGPTPAPVSFFEAPKQGLSLESPEELLSQLQNVLSGNQAPGFSHLLLNIQGNALSAEQFLEGAGITMPRELKDKLMGNPMLFVYVARDEKRLGVLFELQDAQGASLLLKSWEQTMEQDTAAFFEIMGRKGPAYTPFFRSSAYQGTQVRFQTFSTLDLGIVYSVVEDKLLLTGSLESFERVVDLLTSA